jgi:tRNA(fMet)-specific endonuclease VapC
VSAQKVSDIVVVDTDVISFIVKGDTRAARYQQHLDGRLQVIAAQSRAELELWASSHNWGWSRRNSLNTFLRLFLFAAADEAICLRWAEVQDNSKRKGRPISCADTWIAATALSYGVPLVTHNPADFRNVLGLTIISEP